MLRRFCIFLLLARLSVSSDDFQEMNFNLHIEHHTREYNTREYDDDLEFMRMLSGNRNFSNNSSNMTSIVSISDEDNSEIPSSTSIPTTTSTTSTVEIPVSFIYSGENVTALVFQNIVTLAMTIPSNNESLLSNTNLKAALQNGLAKTIGNGIAKDDINITAITIVASGKRFLKGLEERLEGRLLQQAASVAVDYEVKVRTSGAAIAVDNLLSGAITILLTLQLNFQSEIQNSTDLDNTYWGVIGVQSVSAKGVIKTLYGYTTPTLTPTTLIPTTTTTDPWSQFTNNPKGNMGSYTPGKGDSQPKDWRGLMWIIAGSSFGIFLIGGFLLTYDFEAIKKKKEDEAKAKQKAENDAREEEARKKKEEEDMRRRKEIQEARSKGEIPPGMKQITKVSNVKSIQRQIVTKSITTFDHNGDEVVIEREFTEDVEVEEAIEEKLEVEIGTTGDPNEVLDQEEDDRDDCATLNLDDLSIVEEGDAIPQDADASFNENASPQQDAAQQDAAQQDADASIQTPDDAGAEEGVQKEDRVEV